MGAGHLDSGVLGGDGNRFVQNPGGDVPGAAFTDFFGFYFVDSIQECLDALPETVRACAKT
jgi:hypothetical protein